MYNLLAYQIIAHLSLGLVIWRFDFHWFLASILVYALMITIGISAGYHRLLSHRGYQTSSWFKILGLLIGTLGLNASGLVWAAMHREHHAHSDDADDPHSPVSAGILRTYFGIVVYQPKLRYAKDLLRDQLVMFFHKHYFKINLAYDAILLAIDPMLVVRLHLLPAVILWHATAAINVWSHLPGFGYRSYEDTDDHSRNSHLLALLIAGEGYHNNHHHDPKNTNFAHGAGEFDITGWLISKIRKDRA